MCLEKESKDELYTAGTGSELANIIKSLPTVSDDPDAAESNEAFAQIVLKHIADNEINNLKIGTTCDLISTVAKYYDSEIVQGFFLDIAGDLHKKLQPGY